MGFTRGVKNGAHLDRRVYKDVVPIASSFGVVSAILCQKCPKPDKKDAYSCLVDAINSIKIDSYIQNYLLLHVATIVLKVDCK